MENIKVIDKDTRLDRQLGFLITAFIFFMFSALGHLWSVTSDQAEQIQQLKTEIRSLR